MRKWEWDAAKNEKTLRERGFDFDAARLIFEGPVHLEPADRDGERRWQAIGMIDDLYFSVIYTKRFDPKRRRIISARRARDNEKEAWDRRYRR